jgi:hypothetical protein
LLRTLDPQIEELDVAVERAAYANDALPLTISTEILYDNVCSRLFGSRAV